MAYSSGRFLRWAPFSIIKGILSLYQKNEAVDIVTVVDELKKMKTLDKAGGYEYIVDILNSVPSTNGIIDDIVREKAILRNMITTGTDVVANAYNDSDDAENILVMPLKTLPIFRK